MPITFYNHPIALFRQEGFSVEVYDASARTWKPMPFADFYRFMPESWSISSQEAQERIIALHKAAEKASRVAVVHTAVTPKHPWSSANPHPVLVGRCVSVTHCPAMRLLGLLALAARKAKH